MSDKSSLPPDLPGAWTGTAPDADALFAMAEAALATMPDVFKPHIEGVATRPSPRSTSSIPMI